MPFSLPFLLNFNYLILNSPKVTFSKWPEKNNQTKNNPKPHQDKTHFIQSHAKAAHDACHFKGMEGTQMLNEPLVALDFPQSMRSFFLHLWYPITWLHARPSATKQLWTLLQFSSTQGFFSLQTLPSYHKPSLFWEFLVFTSSTREWKDKQDITKLQLYHNVNKLLLLLGYINNSVWAKIKTHKQLR